MNRVMTFVNLIGVLGLAVLCGFQWQANGRAVATAAAAQQAQAETADRLTEQTRLATTAAADLVDVRARLADAEASGASARDRLASASAERDQLRSQVAADKSALAQWSAAVAQRDAALKRVASERDDAIVRCNHLVAKADAAVPVAR